MSISSVLSITFSSSQTSSNSNSSQVQNQIKQLQQAIIKEQASTTDNAQTKQLIIQMLEQEIQILEMQAQQKSQVQQTTASDSIASHSNSSPNTIDTIV
jgi:hypothetical protein